MSYSLRVEAGDLVVGNKRALQTVTGKEKLFQDLKLWLLERVGTDPATPSYGSRLDGGVANNQIVPSYIGALATEENMNEIKSEILSLLQTYQQNQLAKMKKEVTEFGNHTLRPNEVLRSINDIEVKQVGTSIIVRVNLSTLSKDTFNLTIPLAV
jgi:hypothetical protein